MEHFILGTATRLVLFCLTHILCSWSAQKERKSNSLFTIVYVVYVEKQSVRRDLNRKKKNSRWRNWRIDQINPEDGFILSPSTIRMTPFVSVSMCMYIRVTIETKL
ncbi:hypothetical protein BDB00DRAFT_828678 [Zychaea mexicana]|uniref:uncharacterized protein n=1 Tax=Zychaea mexicana TaxID=64656 RepID=UPI0022FEC8EB|nr:uncharacterized protein BDB00DRAFT_828678 [Zychaea mexicana]KAI9492357.1 hypothetical protein BDB00DRAFT_828678 [Zychaea mexicana]